MTAMSPRKQAWASTGVIFAAAMMLMTGLFQFFEGLAAIIRNSFFVAASNYVYKINVTGWGWIHLILGAIVAITGIFIFAGADWARGVGIGLAILSALSQFFFLPYYPWWSLLIIALDVFVIWALATAPSRDTRFTS